LIGFSFAVAMGTTLAIGTDALATDPLVTEPTTVAADRSTPHAIIEQLGSERFQTRRAAAESLRRMRGGAIGLLQSASEHPSAEVRMHAEALLAELHQRSDHQLDASRSMLAHAAIQPWRRGLGASAQEAIFEALCQRQPQWIAHLAWIEQHPSTSQRHAPGRWTQACQLSQNLGDVPSCSALLAVLCDRGQSLRIDQQSFLLQRLIGASDRLGRGGLRVVGPMVDRYASRWHEGPLAHHPASQVSMLRLLIAYQQHATARSLAETLLTDRSAAAESIQAALLTVWQCEPSLGGQGDSHRVRSWAIPLTEDGRRCNTEEVASSRYLSLRPQVRDTAVMVLLASYGHDPRSLGFAPPLADPQFGWHPATIGFGSTHERSAAFDRAAQWMTTSIEAIDDDR
jgi:hypothetical protein